MAATSGTTDVFLQTIKALSDAVDRSTRERTALALKSSQFTDDLVVLRDCYTAVLGKLSNAQEELTSSIKTVAELRAELLELRSAPPQVAAQDNAGPSWATVANHGASRNLGSSSRVRAQSRLRAQAVARNAITVVVSGAPDASLTADQVKSSIVQAFATDASQIPVERCVTRTDGRVFLTFGSQDAADKLQAKVATINDQSTAPSLCCQVLSKRDPTMTIFDVPTSVTKEQLTLAIQRNDRIAACVSTGTEKFEVLFPVRSRNRDNLQHWVLRVSSGIRHVLKQIGRVYCGFESYRVVERDQPLQCFRCGGFNHTAPNCKDTPACMICGSASHQRKDCPASESTARKCVNCTRHNEQFSTHFNTSHAAYDHSACIVYQRNRSRLISNTNYGVHGY